MVAMQRNAALVALALSLFWLLLVSTGLPFIGGPYQGNDWKVFYAAAYLVSQGQAPYTLVAEASHPVYLYAMLAWASYTTPTASYALWTALSILVMLWAACALCGGSWQAVVALLASPFFALVVLLGEVTALEILGILLVHEALKQEGTLRASVALSAALVFLSAVPPNTFPLATWVAYSAARRGLWRLLLALVPLLVVIGASFLVLGNWLAAYSRVPGAAWEGNSRINLSLWATSPVLGILALVIVLAVGYGSRAAFMLASPKVQLLFVTASTLLITPYLLGHRLLPVYALGCSVLSERGKWYPLGLLVASYLLFAVGSLAGSRVFALIIPALYLYAIFLIVYPAPSLEMDPAHGWPTH